MTLPAKYPPAVTPENWNAMVDITNKISRDDWDAIIDILNGVAEFGVFETGVAFVIRKTVDGFYEAISGNGILRFGGPDIGETGLGAGGVDGEDAAAVIQAALDALTNLVTEGGGIVAIREGRYEINTPIKVDCPEVTIIGIGLRAPHIVQADGANISHMFLPTSGGHRFVNLFLDGNNANNLVANTVGIWVPDEEGISGADISVEMCWLGYFRGAGIKADRATWTMRILNSSIEFNGIGVDLTQPQAFSIMGNLFVGHDDRSIYLRGTDWDDDKLGGVINANTFTRSINYDIFLGDMQNVNVEGNFFGGECGTLGDVTVCLDSTGRKIVVANNIFDGLNNVRRGVYLDTGVIDSLVTNNIFGDFTVIPVTNAGVGNKVEGNIGFVTENCGQTELIATGTTVPHGIALAPKNIIVTAATSGPTDIYVSESNETTFKINFGGGGTHVFYWQAKYKF